MHKSAICLIGLFIVPAGGSIQAGVESGEDRCVKYEFGQGGMVQSCTHKWLVHPGGCTYSFEEPEQKAAELRARLLSLEHDMTLNLRFSCLDAVSEEAKAELEKLKTVTSASIHYQGSDVSLKCFKKPSFFSEPIFLGQYTASYHGGKEDPLFALVRSRPRNGAISELFTYFYSWAIGRSKAALDSHDDYVYEFDNKQAILLCKQFMEERGLMQSILLHPTLEVAPGIHNPATNDDGCIETRIEFRPIYAQSGKIRACYRVRPNSSYLEVSKASGECFYKFTLDLTVSEGVKGALAKLQGKTDSWHRPCLTAPANTDPVPATITKASVDFFPGSQELVLSCYGGELLGESYKTSLKSVAFKGVISQERQNEWAFNEVEAKRMCGKLEIERRRLLEVIQDPNDPGMEDVEI